jgi:hypothetical protein
MVAVHPGQILKRKLRARGLSANKLALARYMFPLGKLLLYSITSVLFHRKPLCDFLAIF